MTLRFFFDHHVPEAIAVGLRRRGVDVLTVAEDGSATLEDEAVLERALRLDRIVFTHDDDFLSIADRWKTAAKEFAGVVYAHQLGITIGGAIRDLEIVARILEPTEIRNEVLFLPL